MLSYELNFTLTVLTFLLAYRGVVPAVGRFLSPQAEGGTCSTSSSQKCGSDLVCSCLALNRGMHVCTDRKNLPSSNLVSLERKGLSCEPYLPTGAMGPMPPPPLIDFGGKVVDPRKCENDALERWAKTAGGNHYTQYLLVRMLEGPNEEFPESGGKTSEGIPVLAGKDVKQADVQKHAAALFHLLYKAMLPPRRVADVLISANVRLLLAGLGSPGQVWLGHPEINVAFATGLGGGAPWFPSFGIQADESPAFLAEELFHTIQYVVMRPREVCMYHRAYGNAVRRGLYTTDGSADEVDGEPVPTVQADEYFAMVLQRWLGNPSAASEYKVPGNTKLGTGREHLRQEDPDGFCLLSFWWRSDDIWNPDPSMEPWKTWPNKAIPLNVTRSFCKLKLAALERGCPPASTEWPRRSPSRGRPDPM